MNGGLEINVQGRKRPSGWRTVEVETSGRRSSPSQFPEGLSRGRPEFYCLVFGFLAGTFPETVAEFVPLSLFSEIFLSYGGSDGRERLYRFMSEVEDSWRWCGSRF